MAKTRPMSVDHIHYVPDRALHIVHFTLASVRLQATVPEAPGPVSVSALDPNVIGFALPAALVAPALRQWIAES